MRLSIWFWRGFGVVGGREGARGAGGANPAPGASASVGGALGIGVGSRVEKG